jgi:Na+/proline symporter
MLTRLPAGLLGLVVASLIAAFMSTISTHLNWGSSYVALDFYKRFLKPEATEKELVNVGRLSTLLLMVIAACIALLLSDALSTFSILLQIGAGTGLIFILRWFWWRVNAYSEITGMIVSFVLALVFEFTELGLDNTEKLLYGVGLTTVSWMVVTLVTRPTDTAVLAEFYNLVRPYGRGWQPFRRRAEQQQIQLKTSTDNFTIDLALMLLGVLFVYSSLFGTGYLIYGNTVGALTLGSLALISGVAVFKLWGRHKKNRPKGTV